ncbi:hypothetical protein OKW43_007816 [Paraburkholderia sp. WC7.3g]|uniref:hypothetical protein n=1 Tax=Paraburkholderia sp. WC7.3g TaxID=2991070 RepID=UPI003D220ACF
MKVFVVIDDVMGGDVFSSVHRTRPEDRQGAKVREVTVVGAQTDSEFVYIAQTYDGTMDVHRFKGAYGDYETAKLASGPQGVQPRFEI